jgi:glycosyltransferase involved in cell wall biosynthesis
VRTSDAQATPSLLIPSNFSNRTGFAWRAFFKLFRRVAESLRADGLGTVLSYGEIEGDVELVAEGLARTAFEFDPFDISLASLRQMRRAVRENRIRYVYWTDFPSWHWTYPLLRLWGVRRIVVHSHISVASPHRAEPERGIRRSLKTLLHRLPWIGADRILTCSDFVRHRLVEKACFPEERITVIHYGLPDASFSAQRPATSSAAGAVVRVLCAARATRVKGIDVLIEATRLLKDRTDLPEFIVEFAGEGPDLEDFRKTAAESGLSGHFRFLGYVEDVGRRMADADVVVIPSVWGDAFPYSVLEAMAAGKAIVASRAGGIPEQLGEPGTGLLVPPGDAGALADSLASLLTDPALRRRLGQAARTRAEAEFREDRYYRAVIEELREAFDITDPR